ncbi:MAG: hypothetical protein P4N59_10025 [Negativicutes bacterium]|nr:hypothetical protein [Negativicutes bacterium]
MGVKVYKLENGNYVLVDGLEAERIKTIDDLKSQNTLLSVAGAALAIPAAVVSAPELAVILAGAGIIASAKTMFNNEDIRKLEGKNIDYKYLLEQFSAFQGVLFPAASLAARGLQTSENIVKTLDGTGMAYSFVDARKSVSDLSLDRQHYKIVRDEDINYENWKAGQQSRINNQTTEHSSYYGNALKKLGERAATEGSDNISDASTTSKPTMNEYETAQAVYQATQKTEHSSYYGDALEKLGERATEGADDISDVGTTSRSTVDGYETAQAVYQATQSPGPTSEYRDAINALVQDNNIQPPTNAITFDTKGFIDAIEHNYDGIRDYFNSWLGR